MDHARDHGDVERVQLMGDAVSEDRIDTRVAEDGFVDMGCRGIAFVGGIDIERQQSAQLGESFNEALGEFIGAGRGVIRIDCAALEPGAGGIGALVLESPAELFAGDLDNAAERDLDMMSDVVAGDIGAAEEPGKHERADEFDHLGDGVAAGELLRAQVTDARFAGDRIDKRFDEIRARRR